MAIIVLLSAVTNLTTAYAFLQAELLTFLFFAIMSYSTQIIIWTERYIGIFYPYFYQRWIVKKSVVKALVVLLVLSTTIYLIAYFTARLGGVLDFFIHTFPLTVAWCAYVQMKTYLLVRRIRCETRSLATSQQQRSAEAHTFATSKATKVGVSIFFTMICCYTPYLAQYFVYLFDLVKSEKVIPHCTWSAFLIAFNSICNFIIYSNRMGEIRGAIRRLVWRR